jgi:putative transposase
VNKKSTKSDLARIDRMKDSEIDYSDIPPLDKSFFTKATAAWPPTKQQLTIRLDADVLKWLKAHGRGYQTRINRIGETSVSKYMVRRRRPPSQTWKTFLANHVKSMVSVDFFTVPTIRFQILYVFLVLAHNRRRILHFAVTAHPTAEWSIQQLQEAFPWDTAPQYLLRDRDRIFGKEFVDQVKAMGIKQVLSAPRSPWQRAYVERVIGTIRRECLDHFIVLNERSLYWHLRDFIAYYHRTRTHLGLQKDTPESRPIQSAEAGRIISIPEVGGLHHRYERCAA